MQKQQSPHGEDTEKELSGKYRGREHLCVSGTHLANAHAGQAAYESLIK